MNMNIIIIGGAVIFVALIVFSIVLYKLTATVKTLSKQIDNLTGQCMMIYDKVETVLNCCTQIKKYK